MLIMDHDDPVMSGTLLFPPQGMVFNKLTKKKCWHQKYCLLFKASKQGIERLEIYDSKEDCTAAACSRIITLENCIKITHGNGNAITIVTKSSTQQISVLSENETLEWLTALQSVAFRDDSKATGIDEDNDLYCSSGEGVFSVKLCPSDASKRCGFETIRYILILTTTSIELRGLNDNKLYATWPYRYVRRYGYSEGKFTFEAGRKCQTGEGTFHLEHSNQQEIFKCLSLKMKSMKKMMNGESHLSLDRHDSQIHAVLSMEARSRSPLPVSSSHGEELSFGSVSLKTNSVASQSVDLTATLLSNSQKPTLKPKPLKPPRKHIFAIAKDKHESDFVSNNIHFGKYRKLENYEPIEQIVEHSDTIIPSKPYDKVEVRSEAWRTLGLEDVDHKEFFTKSIENGRCLKLISRSQDNLDADAGESSVIILQTPNVDPEDANYDRLQHFGSTNKLNKSTELATYKQVEPRPSFNINSTNRNNIWNDYDEVENVMQSVRLADDSHLGYGMIRKPNLSVANHTTFKTQDSLAIPDIDHKKHNGSDYALVSRPKRV